MKDSDFFNNKTGNIIGVNLKMTWADKKNKKKPVPTFPESNDFAYETLYSPRNLFIDYIRAKNEEEKQTNKDEYNNKIEELERLGYKFPFRKIIE